MKKTKSFVESREKVKLSQYSKNNLTKFQVFSVKYHEILTLIDSRIERIGNLRVT